MPECSQGARYPVIGRRQPDHRRAGCLGLRHHRAACGQRGGGRQHDIYHHFHRRCRNGSRGHGASAEQRSVRRPVSPAALSHGGEWLDGRFYQQHHGATACAGAHGNGQPGDAGPSPCPENGLQSPPLSRISAARFAGRTNPRHPARLSIAWDSLPSNCWHWTTDFPLITLPPYRSATARQPVLRSPTPAVRRSGTSSHCSSVPEPGCQSGWRLYSRPPVEISLLTGGP